MGSAGYYHMEPEHDANTFHSKLSDGGKSKPDDSI